MMKPIAMQTSVVSFTHREEAKAGDKRKGIVVDLIGAVHVADKSYFKQLNRTFPKYEVTSLRTGGSEGKQHPARW